MNSDEIQSAIVKVVCMAGAGWAGAHGIGTDQLSGTAGAFLSLVSLGYGIYSHWNMKKVPETATVVGTR